MALLFQLVDSGKVKFLCFIKRWKNKQRRANIEISHFWSFCMTAPSEEKTARGLIIIHCRVLLTTQSAFWVSLFSVSSELYG